MMYIQLILAKSKSRMVGAVDRRMPWHTDRRIHDQENKREIR